MNTEVIKAANNMEKYYTYKELMERYKKAYEQEFYFESMFILYAVMEDRLRAILYHSDVIKQREDKNLDYSSNSKYLTEMFYEYNGNIARKNHNIDFSKIFNKISMVRAILRWERQNTDYISSDYLKKLKIQYKEIDKQYFLKALNDVEKWKNYRNELIHSVLENNIDSINDTLKEKVDEGKQLINQLTELSRLVKKNSFVLVN